MKIRLCYIVPVIKSWPQAINLGMQPENLQKTILKLSESMNLICSISEESFYDYNKNTVEVSNQV